MLDPESLAELEALFTEVCQPGRPTGESAAALIAGLKDAAQAHREWAKDLLDQCLMRGALEVVKRRLVDASPPIEILSSAGETYATVRTIAGRKVDGRWVQDPMLAWSWDDVVQWRDRNETSRNSSQGKVTAAERLLVLRAEHAETIGPKEACDKAGLTLDQVIGGAA